MVQLLGLLDNNHSDNVRLAAVGALLESDPLLQTPGGGASYVPFTTAPGSPST